jgi:hypothetical protein
MEDSNAKETLRAFPGAAGAYDLVPLASASAVFSLDTSTDILLLHALQVPRPPSPSPTEFHRSWVHLDDPDASPYATPLHTGDVASHPTQSHHGGGKGYSSHTGT